MWHRQTKWAVAAALFGALSLTATGCDSKRKETKVVEELSATTTPVGETTKVVPKTTPVVTGPVSFKDAEGAFESRRYEEATTLFKGYTTQKPENAYGHYMLGLSSWKSGNFEQAETELLRSIELNPTHVKSLYNLGRVYLDNGQPEKAVEQIETGLKIDSTSGDGYRLLGRAYDNLGKLPESEQAYRMAIKLNTEDSWSMNNLGLVFIKEKCADEAIGVLARAVQLKPDNARFQNNLGMALELNGYNVAAGDAYQTAAELDSSYTKAVENLSRVKGREDKKGLPELKLDEVAQNFVSEIGVPKD
jgi:superkiller protein 3